MRPLISAFALYAAFMAGRYYATNHDRIAPLSAAQAPWTGADMESELPYRSGFEAGYQMGRDECALPGVIENHKDEETI